MLIAIVFLKNARSASQKNCVLIVHELNVAAGIQSTPIKNFGKEFCSYSDKLTAIFCKVVFTKSLGLGLTVSSKTIGSGGIFLALII